ncbi:MAG: hypothetical protein HY898_01020 [Deltaproteobacteria bacterium]|nr:hypothetical protein [Deltaproteobacteria bacterium]
MTVHATGSPCARRLWPSHITTTAAKYRGFKTTGQLRKAYLDRKVFPVGKRGRAGGLVVGTRRPRWTQ